MPPIIPIPNDIPENTCEQSSSDVDGENAVNIISDSDSPSDDENPGHEGYEPLSQDPDSFIVYNCDLEEDSNFILEDDPNVSVENVTHQPANSYVELLPAPIADETVAENTNECPEFNMDEEHIETIKSLMKGITLPTSNLPQWATLVPEEEWKSAIFSKVLKNGKKELKNRNNADKLPSNAHSSDYQSDIPR